MENVVKQTLEQKLKDLKQLRDDYLSAFEQAKENVEKYGKRVDEYEVGIAQLEEALSEE